MDLIEIPNPQDSNIYSINMMNKTKTPTGSNIYRKTRTVQYATPMGSYLSHNSFSINMLSLQDKTKMPKPNPKG